MANAAFRPQPRHAVTVRLTHWVTALCFVALVISGMELVISHPRFYWGETGNVNTPALFQLPIPASRSMVKTGFDYVLPDQNGWSRSLHFQSAWLVVFAALAYGWFGLRTGHFGRNLLPVLSWPALRSAIADHLRFRKPPPEEAASYNVLQRAAYSAVVFLLFPLMIWTGLAMSPAFTSAFPFAVTVFGGHQSARTIHFFVCLLLVGFLVVHIGMVILAGFQPRMRAMIQEKP